MNIVWLKKNFWVRARKNPAHEESDLHNYFAAVFEVLSSGGGASDGA